jgi:hypothetical protein
MSPVMYELGFYIPEDGIFHNHCSENLKSYMRASNFRNIMLSSVRIPAEGQTSQNAVVLRQQNRLEKTSKNVRNQFVSCARLKEPCTVTHWLRHRDNGLNHPPARQKQRPQKL